MFRASALDVSRNLDDVGHGNGKLVGNQDEHLSFVQSLPEYYGNKRRLDRHPRLACEA
jgi:hypothetical protein